MKSTIHEIVRQRQKAAFTVSEASIVPVLNGILPEMNKKSEYSGTDHSVLHKRM